MEVLQGLGLRIEENKMRTALFVMTAIILMSSYGFCTDYYTKLTKQIIVWRKNNNKIIRINFYSLFIDIGKFFFFNRIFSI